MTETGPTAWPLPPGTDTTARSWLRRGAPAGPAPRAAASVCLLRDDPAGTAGPQVLWITRGHQLAVAPGSLAFPGGAVDPEDRARRPDEPAVPDRFAVLARAAARELAEETGHLVAAPALRPLARWVTPEHEPRRFDTTFLVGLLPPTADPDPLPPGGVHEHGWAPPGELLADVAAGRRRALPPTRAVLARLAAAVGAVLAGRAGPGALPAPDPAADGGGPARDVVARLAREAVLVPVVPRAAWRDGDTAEEERRGIDLLLPRHAGEVP